MILFWAITLQFSVFCPLFLQAFIPWGIIEPHTQWRPTLSNRPPAAAASEADVGRVWNAHKQTCPVRERVFDKSNTISSKPCCRVSVTLYHACMVVSSRHTSNPASEPFQRFPDGSVIKIVIPSKTAPLGEGSSAQVTDMFVFPQYSTR